VISSNPVTNAGRGFKAGSLIVNADDWGRDRETTVRILDCIRNRSVSSVSAMVFMDDSERAAEVARARAIDAGLHLNMTTAFSAAQCSSELVKRQNTLASHLRRPFASVVFHPGLRRSFEYVVAAQIDEFRRLYGREPKRLDGHHHMHLCPNVLLGGLLSPGTIVRRNFCFQAGEKSLPNRLFRWFIDRRLARRHSLTDFFFSLPPLEPPERLQRIFELARRFVIELETHPVNPAEYRFLAGGEIFRALGDFSIASHYAVRAPHLAGRGTRIEDP